MKIGMAAKQSSRRGVIGNVIFRNGQRRTCQDSLVMARHCQVAELAALLCGCGRVEKMSDGNRNTMDPDRK